MSNTIKKISSISLALTTAVWFSGAAMVLPAVASAATVSELQTQIQALLTQIQQLQDQLKTAGGQATVSIPTITHNLTVGSKGSDVKALQEFLNAQGFEVAKTGAGSPGHETTIFGPLTKAALAKYQTAKGITPAIGYFGPKTRAYLASLAAAPTTPTTPTTIPTTPTATTTAPVANVAVALASDNPAGVNFPAGASQVSFLKLTFTAGSQDVTVTAMNVYRGGLSSDNDISNVYLKSKGIVLATNLGLSNGKATFSVPSGIFTVKAGTSKNITVAADIASGNTTSHTYSWSVNAASDITANVAVSGTFPLTGNAFTAVSVSNPGLAYLNIQPITTGGTVNAGTNAFLAGEFSLQANNSAIQVKSIKITETGTINAASDLANIKLMNGSTQVGATAAALNADGTVVFDLSSNPLQIASGQTINLMVYADVVGGVNRNFTLTIQRAYDVVGTDMTYNVGASNTGTFPVSGSAVAVSQGTLTVSRDANSPANYLVAGATNQNLASFDFAAAGEAVRVTALTYQIVYTNLAANAVWNNLKLVDDQGVQIGTVQTSGSTSGTSSGTSTVVSLTNLNYIIPAGTTRILSIKADIVSNYNGTIQGSITSGTAQGYTSLASASVTPQSGNVLSANVTPFAAGPNNAVGSITTVSGASAVKIASFVLSAGPAEGVNVVSVTLTTAASNVTGHFQNLVAKYGTSQIGYNQAVLANSTAYTFSASSPIAISAGGTAVIDVYADTISGATSSAASVVSLTGASATGASSNAVRSLSGAPVGQNVTVNPSGTLTASLAATPVISQQVAMGVTVVKLGSFQLTANNNEPIDITNVAVYATTSLAADIRNIKLMNGSTQVGSTIPGLQAATGTVTFTVPSVGSAGSLQVPQNGNVTLDVVADINSINNAVSANTVTIGLGIITYSGDLSHNTANTSGVIGSGATFTIYQGVLSVANAIGTTGVPALGTTDSNGTVIGAITFTNNSPANQNLTLASTTVALTVYNATSTVTTSTITVYDATVGRVAGTSTITLGSNVVVNLNTNTVTLSPNTTRTLYIYVSPFTSAQKVTTTNPISGNASLPEYYWSDGVTNNITHNPAITTMPAWSNITLVP